MNLILLLDDDFIGEDHVRLAGRRFDHVARVHRASPGDALVVGRVGGRIGRGEVIRVDGDAVELRVRLDQDPPPPLELTLVLALPRPKVLNRVIAGATTMGVKKIILINAWRVEKSYWSSPRLSAENMMLQRILGLEQARDTVLPVIETRRLFRSFVEQELDDLAAGSLRLVAHPRSATMCPRAVQRPVTLVIGPEGGLVDREVASLERLGFTPVSMGPRVLRVETAVAALIGRLF